MATLSNANNYGFGEDFILAPQFLPGGTFFNTAHYGEVLLSIQKKLQTFKGTISPKRKKGRIEYYLQYRKGGKRHEVYIRKDKVEAVLQNYRKKKRLKTALLQLKKVLSTMPEQTQRDIRKAMALCEEEHILDGRKIERQLYAHRDPNLKHAGEVYIDGTHLRSRAELVCWAEACNWRYDIQYEPAVYTEKQIRNGWKPYRPDFMVTRKNGKVCYWEHMGFFHDPYYVVRQRQKLRDYRDLGIFIGKNLIITESKSFFDTRRMLWQNVCGGLIDARTALNKIRKLKAAGLAD